MRSTCLVVLAGCASTAPIRAIECPPTGTEVPYAKLVNPAFKDAYAGCEIVTTVQFAGSGWGDAVCPSSPPGVTFRVKAPGDPGRTDVLATEGGLAVIRKDASDLVFSAKVGDALKVHGKTWVSEWTGCTVLVTGRVSRETAPAVQPPAETPALPTSPAPTTAPPTAPAQPAAPPPSTSQK